MGGLNSTTLQRSLTLLGERLMMKGSERLQLVVCGGASLIVLGIVSRSTADVDVVAMASWDGYLYSPVPFPRELR